MKKHPNELIDWVRDNYMSMDTETLAKECNARFGTNLTRNAMQQIKTARGLTGGPRRKGYHNHSKLFPQEERRFIEKNHKGVGHKQMAEMLEKEFGTHHTAAQIKSYYGNHHINSGLTGRFEKGTVAHNKGKKMSPENYEKIKGTFFKPGNIPQNTLPVGAEVITKDGYRKTKVADPNIWEFTHRIVYRQHYGEIPEGMIVGFKDNDKTNIKPENLMLLNKQEHLQMNKEGLKSEYAEITEAGLALTRLTIAVKKRRRK